MTKVRVRFIRKADMEEVMEAEREHNAIVDPDFGVVLAPWVKSADDVLGLIKQRRDRSQSTYDTRTFVAEVSLETIQGNEVEWVCGAFSYELQPTAYEVVWMCIHPKGPELDVLTSFLSHLREKAEASSTRKTVTILLRDRDEAGIRKLLPHLRKEGFKISLVRDHFEDNIDAWRCEFTTEQVAIVG